MTDATDHDAETGLERDWVTIWQSEFAALAVDREAREAWRALLRLWPGLASPADAAARRPSPEPTAGAASAPAASCARDEAIGRLTARVDELERRLLALERPRARRGRSDEPA